MVFIFLETIKRTLSNIYNFYLIKYFQLLKKDDILNIFYIIFIIYFLYLLNLKYKLFSRYKNKSYKFKLLNRVFCQKHLFYPLILIILILSLITFKLNFLKIEKSFTNKLSNYIALNYDRKSEFIIDKNLEKYFKYPRELGGINIFHDNYYPFATKSIIEWRQRGELLSDLEDCVNSNLSSCKLSIGAKVFYFSDVFQDKFQVNNKSFYINKLEFLLEKSYINYPHWEKFIKY